MASRSWRVGGGDEVFAIGSLYNITRPVQKSRVPQEDFSRVVCLEIKETQAFARGSILRWPCRDGIDAIFRDAMANLEENPLEERRIAPEEQRDVERDAPDVVLPGGLHGCGVKAIVPGDGCGRGGRTGDFDAPREGGGIVVDEPETEGICCGRRRERGELEL